MVVIPRPCTSATASTNSSRLATSEICQRPASLAAKNFVSRPVEVKTSVESWSSQGGCERGVLSSRSVINQIGRCSRGIGGSRARDNARLLAGYYTYAYAFDQVPQGVIEYSSIRFSAACPQRSGPVGGYNPTAAVDLEAQLLRPTPHFSSKIVLSQFDGTSAGRSLARGELSGRN